MSYKGQSQGEYKVCQRSQKIVRVHGGRGVSFS